MVVPVVVVLMACRGEGGTSILVSRVVRGSADVPCASWRLAPSPWVQMFDHCVRTGTHRKHIDDLETHVWM